MPINFGKASIEEIGYAENVFATPLGASLGPVDLVGGLSLSIFYIPFQGPLYITFGGGVMYHTTATQEPILLLLEDGVEICRMYAESDINNAIRESQKTCRRIPSPGPHTYKLQLTQTNAVASAAITGALPNDPIILAIRQG